MRVASFCEARTHSLRPYLILWGLTLFFKGGLILWGQTSLYEKRHKKRQFLNFKWYHQTLEQIRRIFSFCWLSSIFGLVYKTPYFHFVCFSLKSKKQLLRNNLNFIFAKYSIHLENNLKYMKAGHSSALDCLLFTQPPLTGQPPMVAGHRVKALLVFVYLVTTNIILYGVLIQNISNSTLKK